MAEPIIGRGLKGEPFTARQAFQQSLHEVDEELHRQEQMSEDDHAKLAAKMGGDVAAFRYLRIRLQHKMSALYIAAKQLPPEMFTIPLES